VQDRGTPSVFDYAQLPDAGQRHKVNVLVVSSVALAFMSFWRAASIVLCDLASTAYYIGGISEQAVGKAAPWFILAVMLFVYPVTSVYMESCTLFTRGGVYKVVKGAVGGGLAKLSVSALMFDYILTGPISSVAAGQYLLGLIGDMLKLASEHTAHPIIFDATTHPHVVNLLTMLVAISITAYFWRTNIIGIHESSERALRIMQLTTVMGVLIFAWSALTIWKMPHGMIHTPPFHPIFTQSSLDPTKQASSGWLEHFPRILGSIGILVAFGHSLLAMSGEESLAQVNREIESPKLKNLLRAGRLIAIYAICLTGVISFLAVAIIPDGKRVITQIVTNSTATTDVARDKTWWEVDYLRPADSAHADNWGYVMIRTTDARGVELLTKTSQELVLKTGLQRTGSLPRRPLVGQNCDGVFCRDRRLPDFSRRGQHQSCRFQRRAEPPGRRRCAHALVPASPRPIWHHESNHQYDRCCPGGGDPRQPRRCQHSG
jgi:hypothetical protein